MCSWLGGLGSAHLEVLAFALVDGCGVAGGTGAEVILGGCEPVDDCRAPGDCDFFDPSVSDYSYSEGKGEIFSGGRIGGKGGKQRDAEKEKGTYYRRCKW